MSKWPRGEAGLGSIVSLVAAFVFVVSSFLIAGHSVYLPPFMGALAVLNVLLAWRQFSIARSLDPTDETT